MTQPKAKPEAIAALAPGENDSLSVEATKRAFVNHTIQAAMEANDGESFRLALEVLGKIATAPEKGPKDGPVVPGGVTLRTKRLAARDLAAILVKLAGDAGARGTKVGVQVNTPGPGDAPPDDPAADRRAYYQAMLQDPDGRRRLLERLPLLVGGKGEAPAATSTSGQQPKPKGRRRR